MAEQDQNTPPAPPAGHAKPKQPPAPAPAGTASPLQHAKAIGAHRMREVRKGDLAVTSLNGQAVDLGVFSWQHAAAAALHGWAEHEHHEAKPVDLSLDDYKKALLAASAPVVRATADVDDKSIVVKREKEDPRTVIVSAKKGDAIDLRKLQITTEELANGGVSFTADYEPHPAALSPHSAHAKNAERKKQADAAPLGNDDSHLFAKA